MRLSPIQGAVAALALLGLGAASGCGYALVGRGTVVDPSIKTVGVPTFSDRTGKPGLDRKVTDKVIEELLKRGRFDVINDRTGADAVVDGELISYQALPVGFGEGEQTEQTQATRYAIVLTARVRYAKVGETEPIWENAAFRYQDEYDVGDPENFFDREEQSIDRLVDEFSRNLVAAMMEAF